MKSSTAMRVTAVFSATMGLLAPPMAISSYAAEAAAVLNAAGGTTASNGLRIDAADGVVQITRAGKIQVMDDARVPSGNFVPSDLLQNTFLVLSTSPDPTVIGLNTKLTTPGMVAWDSAVSAVTSADGKNGTVTSVMTKDLDGDVATTSDIYKVTWTLTVKQPGPTMRSSFKVTLPVGGRSARLYWVTTPDMGSVTTFGSAKLRNPNAVIMASTPSVTDAGAAVAAAARSAQAVHQVVNSTKFRWFVGSAYCVMADCAPATEDPAYGAPADAQGNAGGWVQRGVDLPNWASTYTTGEAGVGADNVLAIQFPAITASFTFLSDWTVAGLAATNTLMTNLQRVAPTFVVAPSRLKTGKSVAVVTKVGFPAATLVSMTPRVCAVSGKAIVAKATGACSVKALVEGAAVKSFAVTVTR